MFYLQLDINNIVVGISELSGKIEKETMIEIEKFDDSLLGKKYENGGFIEVPKTKEQLLQDLKSKYLYLINDAVLLGDETEKERLQQEYQQKKAEIESQ